MTGKTKATRRGRQWVHKKKNRPLGAVNKMPLSTNQALVYSTTQCAAVKDWAGYLCCCMACLISWSPKNGMTCLTGDIKQAIASRKASTHKTHVPMPIDSPLFKMMIEYQPFGSMPCLLSSARASSLNQFPRLMPSRSAAASSCSLNSGISLILNIGDLPAPFGLLSLFTVDMYRPVEIVSCLLGLYTNMYSPNKTTPSNGITSTERGLTTNAN